MKFLIVLSSLVMLTYAQRPSFAGSGPIGRPGLASRFKDDNETSSSTVSVENRVGEDGSTPKIPVDARGDADLVNTLNTWEREHQPFWLLNADHIEKARNTTRGGQQITNRDQFNIQSDRGSQTNQGARGSQASLQGSAQSNLSDRIGSPDGVDNSGNRRYPTANNRDWIFGKRSQGDVKPVYEAPEASLSGQRFNQDQRQTEGSQKRPRFHYERNHFH